MNTHKNELEKSVDLKNNMIIDSNHIKLIETKYDSMNFNIDHSKEIKINFISNSIENKDNSNVKKITSESIKDLNKEKNDKINTNSKINLFKNTNIISSSTRKSNDIIDKSQTLNIIANKTNSQEEFSYTAFSFNDNNNSKKLKYVTNKILYKSKGNDEILDSEKTLEEKNVEFSQNKFSKKNSNESAFKFSYFFSDNSLNTEINNEDHLKGNRDAKDFNEKNNFIKNITWSCNINPNNNSINLPKFKKSNFTPLNVQTNPCIGNTKNKNSNLCINNPVSEERLYHKNIDSYNSQIFLKTQIFQDKDKSSNLNSTFPHYFKLNSTNLLTNNVIKFNEKKNIYDSNYINNENIYKRNNSNSSGFANYIPINESGNYSTKTKQIPNISSHNRNNSFVNQEINQIPVNLINNCDKTFINNSFFENNLFNIDLSNTINIFQFHSLQQQVLVNLETYIISFLRIYFLTKDKNIIYKGEYELFNYFGPENLKIYADIVNNYVHNYPLLFRIKCEKYNYLYDDSDLEIKFIIVKNIFNYFLNIHSQTLNSSDILSENSDIYKNEFLNRNQTKNKMIKKTL